MKDKPQFIITEIAYHQRSGVGIGGHWQNEPIWVATVEAGNRVYSFSRLPSDSGWCADSCFGKDNMYPYFCHGEGSRCTAKQVATGELAAALDDARAEHASSHPEPEPVYGVA